MVLFASVIILYTCHAILIYITYAMIDTVYKGEQAALVLLIDVVCIRSFTVSLFKHLQYFWRVLYPSFLAFLINKPMKRSCRYGH